MDWFIVLPVILEGNSLWRQHKMYAAVTMLLQNGEPDLEVL